MMIKKCDDDIAQKNSILLKLLASYNKNVIYFNQCKNLIVGIYIFKQYCMEIITIAALK